MRDRSILEPTFELYVIPRDFKRYPIKKGGVCEVATNDANYITNVNERLPNGKQKLIWKCPVYEVWSGVINRGFSYREKLKQPTYKDITVCPEWLLFSNFRNWWIENSVRNWQLDKDILHRGNLMYSPESCIYIPGYINNLLIDSAATRGDYPLGVSKDKDRNKFQSYVGWGECRKWLGRFNTPMDAHKAWQAAKIDCIKDSIARYTEESTNFGVFDQRIVSSLEGRISILQDDVDNGRETFALH